ncbi:mechanosensitive ion channel family protein [Candidatus Bathyarchaeota archaeon]|nr:mechanosensitive ion channel family protein [Candidatus Bathyarchaeota archaeon]
MPRANSDEKSVRRKSLKVLLYIVILSIILATLNFLFGWASKEIIPIFLQPYSDIILLVNPYLPYIQVAFVVVLGAFIINSFSNAAYTYILRLADQSAAATVKTVVRAVGIAILLSIITSILSANPSAAITMGSFSGLIVGFATQTVLSHFVAGIFILIVRPVKFGDIITIAGQVGVVKEMRVMHLVLETQDGATEILIPNGMVFSQVILRKKITVTPKPVAIEISTDGIPRRVNPGSKIAFTGRLTEKNDRKPVIGALIKVIDESGRILSFDTTGNDGKFTATWTVGKTNLESNIIKAYVKFDGDNEHQKAESETIIMELSEEEE